MPLDELGLAEELSRSPGVGLVLARSGDEPTCFWRGKRYQLRESEPGPFARRADAAIVIRDVAELMKMPRAGDLVIYGTDAPEGHVSFIPEIPRQLYDHFIRYQERTA